MPTTPSYAAFRVDPSINFDNFTCSPPNVSNFSRPISFRPNGLSHASHFSVAMSDSSRRSSYVSSKGPMTPEQDVILRKSIAGPKFALVDDEHHSDILSPSFMLDSNGTSNLDLSFAVESVMQSYQSHVVPDPQPLLKQFEPLERQRPATAIALAPAPTPRPTSSHTAKVCPVHGSRQSIIAAPAVRASRTCPVHGTKSPLSAPLSFETPETRSSVAERPQEAPGMEKEQPLPTLPFLKHDPFQSPSVSEKGSVRPRSAGVGASTRQEDDDDFIFDRAKPATKQSAPSIMSTRSTRSIRKGLSRVRRMLNRAKMV